MVVKRLIVTIDTELLEEFYEYADRKGITVSPFLHAKIKEELKSNKNK